MPITIELLPLPLGTDERDAVALGDLEAHIVDGSDAAIGDREVGDRERARAVPHWLRARARARGPTPRHRGIVRAVGVDADQQVAESHRKSAIQALSDK